MSRPFAQNSIEELETRFERASAAQDLDVVRLVRAELSNRQTNRARELAKKIDQYLASSSRPKAHRTRPDQTAQHRAEHRSSGSRPSNSKSSNSGRKPTPEQSDAIARFLDGGSLKINAFAGTGKTSTLEMLAANTDKRGQYIAFNRDIVRDAKQKFPKTVNCATTHSLAFRATASRYGGNSDKLTGRLNANQLAELLNLKRWQVDRHHVLAPRSQGALILETIRRYTQSADANFMSHHVPRRGSLLTAPQESLEAVIEFTLRGAEYVWRQMADEKSDMPLGHDGYLKIWALSGPSLAADFILLDEAQDTNPVVLDVLTKQPAQMIYVGDKYQQIYEWRGAINAMESISTDHATHLTQSFRFGSTIADTASKILTRLGETKPIRGNPNVNSRIGAVDPRAILARTNASTITALIESLDAGKQCHLVGSNQELMELLRGVQDLKNGQPSTVPDFFGFNSWAEVVEFARSPDGQHLLAFVNLVEDRGERQLMWALNRSVSEDEADVVVSTTHKAKGREWPSVRLMDDFVLPSGKTTEGTPDATAERAKSPEELRILYVAVTRAKEVVDLSPRILTILGVDATAAGNSPYWDRKDAQHQAHRPRSGAAARSASSQHYGSKKPSTTSKLRTKHPAGNAGKSSVANSRVSPSTKETPTLRRRGLLDWLLGR